MQRETRRRSRGRRRLAAALAVGAGLVLACMAGEIVLRYLLFGESAAARALGSRLRRPEYFADSAAEDDYWKLQWRFAAPEARRPTPGPDRLCGWTGEHVRPGTYEPVATPVLDGRTPVLLYGDSFAACLTPPEDCFGALMERSDLAGRYALVNYGVRGYGIDQILVLLRASIDRWRDRDPVVIVGLLVDSDFDRSVLSFRCWPKPRFRIEGDGLACEPPETLDAEEYLRRRPLGIASYARRLLAYGPRFMPWSWQVALRPARPGLGEKVELDRRILAEMHRELEQRGLRHFVLLFHGEAGVRSAPSCRWVEDLVQRVARETGVRVVPTRPFLVAAAGGRPKQAARFFGGAPEREGHYNRLGNLVVLEAIREGLEGRFDPIDTSRVTALLAAGRFE